MGHGVEGWKMKLETQPQKQWAKWKKQAQPESRNLKSKTQNQKALSAPLNLLNVSFILFLV